MKRCCLCPPPGNKITDAGVLFDTLRQHQDVVPRDEHTHTLVPHLRFSLPSQEGRRRWNGERGVEEQRETWTDGGSFTWREVLAFRLCPTVHFINTERSVCTLSFPPSIPVSFPLSNTSLLPSFYTSLLPSFYTSLFPSFPSWQAVSQAS